MSPSFSILVPLEFHRGLAMQCIAGWTRHQTVPRDSFQVVVAAPRHGDAAETASIATLLGPQDKLIQCDADHDMPLVAEAARCAQGRVLVFTEAHCLPRPDFLEQSSIVLTEHPHWAGFSGLSIPLTHNRLSEIEAKVYDHDIQNHLKHHPWLKVLDQCFVIRRDAYEACGGIEPEYGHFAEWLLAARLHERGLQIGHDRRPAVEHWYCGDLAELELFTKDFARGQIRLAHQGRSDTCGRLFDDVPIWTNRHQLRPEMRRAMARLVARDLLFVLMKRDLHALRRWPWRSAAQWWHCGGQTPATLLKRSQQKLAQCRQATELHLDKCQLESAANAFRDWLSACVSLGHAEYLADQSPDQLSSCVEASVANTVRWTCDSPTAAATIGFHDLERQADGPFRWTEPVAMVELPSLACDVALQIDWMPFHLPTDHSGCRFYLDERPIPSDRIHHHGRTTTILISAVAGRSQRLAWVTAPHSAPNDARPLGTALAAISWQPTSDRALVERRHRNDTGRIGTLRPRIAARPASTSATT